MSTLLIVVIALSGLIAIAADWNEGKPPLFKLLKPLTTMLVIALAAQAPAGSYRDALLIGLALSRSEEHTSELQSLMRISYAVFCLKTKKKNHIEQHKTH